MIITPPVLRYYPSCPPWLDCCSESSHSHRPTSTLAPCRKLTCTKRNVKICHEYTTVNSVWLSLKILLFLSSQKFQQTAVMTVSYSLPAESWHVQNEISRYVMNTQPSTVCDLPLKILLFLFSQRFQQTAATTMFRKVRVSSFPQIRAQTLRSSDISVCISNNVALLPHIKMECMGVFQSEFKDQNTTESSSFHVITCIWFFP